MNFKQEVLQHYTDQDFQITVDRDPGKWTTGNGLMHLGFFICLLHGSGQLELSDIEFFQKAVNMCQEGNDLGVYDRNQGRQDKNAHDDATGVVSGSAVSGCQFHKDVLSHGIKNFFVYENVDGKFNGIKDLWAFRARFPFLILWYFLLNKKLRILLPIMIAYLCFTKKSDRADSTIMNYCKVESLVSVYPKLKIFRNWWLKHSDLKTKTEEYFKSEHPLIGLVSELKF